MEPKFTHNAGFVGHLEDLVVDRGLRRKGLGRRIVSELLHFAKSAGCYKVLVDCAAANTPFYASLGFEHRNAAMGRYFSQDPVDADNAQHADNAQPADNAQHTDHHDEDWHARCARQSLALLCAPAPPHGLAAALAPCRRAGGFLCRPVDAGDFDRGFVPLLAQLTTVGDLSREAWLARLQMLRAHAGAYLVAFVDEDKDALVALGTLLIEQKLIHSAGLAGHIEDIVVDCGTRSSGIGRAMIDKLRDIASAAGCASLLCVCVCVCVCVCFRFVFVKPPSNHSTS